MVRICCYCRVTIGEKPPYADRTVTHGICPMCLPKAEAMLDRLTQNFNATDKAREVKS